MSTRPVAEEASEGQGEEREPRWRSAAHDPRARPAPARSRELRALAAGGALFVAMYVARVAYARDGLFGFLSWNLFLALVPWLCAVGVERFLARGAVGVAAVLGVTWLLFLPNAPYVVTDLVHLRSRPPVPLWYDALLLGAAALTGLMAGAFSLRRVQVVVRRSLGPRAAVGVVLTALPAAGFGIYLGRFARLNSWDVLLDPFEVAHEVCAAASLRTLVVTVATAALLAVVYLAVGEPELAGAPSNGPRRSAGGGRPHSSGDNPYCSR